MSPQSRGLVAAGCFTSAMEAEVARIHLAENDIESMVLAQTTGGWGPELATSLGVELRVAPEDRAAAIRILDAVIKSRKAGRP